MSGNNHLNRAKFKIITYQQSPHYEGLLSLREKVLRKGLQPYTADQLSLEKDDIHIGLFDIFTSQLIGCFLIKNVDQWCQMRQVAIEPSFQGKGFGSCLIRYFEDYCYNIGCRQLFIEARETAVPFYQHHGYIAIPKPFVNEGSGLFNIRLEKKI
jgi:GNAT superfamily N-acetyltransferase